MRETIAAIATASGAAGVGVIRVSGPQVPAIGLALLGRQPPSRTAQLCRLRDAAGAAIDQALLLSFPAPHSFTGEDVLELHTHGSPMVLAMVLEMLYRQGVRPARPGEFSERAFLEGKLDLAQAEAIADLISARSAAAARAAMRSLDGVFSQLVDQLLQEMIAIPLVDLVVLKHRWPPSVNPEGIGHPAPKDHAPPQKASGVASSNEASSTSAGVGGTTSLMSSK